MTHPGVGPVTALAFVLIIGTPARFKCGKQIGSYVGLIPCEDSSAGHQRLGHITKQGSSLLRFLLGEAAQAAARWDSDWRRRYVHLAMRRQRNIAKVAWPEDSRCGCTGCGGTVGNIQSGSSSVRTRDSSESGMA
jgi:transposase